MPLQKATNSDALMTQYEMHGVEALGLLKFDFLGLSNLTILRQAVDLIRQERGIEIDLEHDPARRRDDVRAARVGRDDRRLPAGVGGHAALHPRAAARRRSTTSRRWSRSSGPGRWTTSRPTSAASTARSRSRTSTRCSSRTSRRRTGSSSTRRTSWPPRWPSAGFTGPEADTLGYAIRKKKSSRAARAEGEVRHAGRGARRRAADHRRGLHGVPAVRALRLQQGPRDVLRADRLPDRVPQGELHRRVHDERPDGVPATRARRSPPRSPSAAGMGIEVRPPDVHRSRRRVHGRGRRDPVRAARGQERRRGRDRVDHRRPRGGRPVPLARRLLLADRPPARRTARSSSRSPGSARSTRSAIRRRSCWASTTRWPRRRPPSATGSPARRRCSTWARTRPARLERPLPQATEAPVRERLALGEGAAGPLPLGPSAGRDGGRRSRDYVDRLLAATSRTSRSTGSASSLAGS